MTTDSIDTNIVLRYILGDVPEQRRLAAELLGRSNTTHYLSSQAILECAYVMEIVEEMPRAGIAESLRLFLARYSGVIEYDREMLNLAIPVYLEHPKLSWVDCALAAEAELKHREPLFTFDKKLANQISNAKLLS